MLPICCDHGQRRPRARAHRFDATTRLSWSRRGCGLPARRLWVCERRSTAGLSRYLAS